LTEFAVNNKVHLVTKISPFIVNYDRKLRNVMDIRRKSRKDNRVCKENEEITRESRSNIEKGLR